MHNNNKFNLFYLLILTIIIGILTGIIGGVFGRATLIATSLRLKSPVFLLLLPVGAIPITVMYKYANNIKDDGANIFLKALNNNKHIPIKIFPIVFVSAIFSHLCGASVGRTGSTLQLGGSFGQFISDKLKLNKDQKNLVLMCSVSGVFSSMFGTPLTGTFFSAELAVIGKLPFKALPFTFISSFLARYVGYLLGVPNQHHTILEIPIINIKSIVLTGLIAVVGGLISLAYCYLLKDLRIVIWKKSKNYYVLCVLFGIILLVLTYCLPGEFQDYNGLGNEAIKRAFNGEVLLFAFALKLLMTSISFIAGYKGGEIYPAVFIGTTLGSALGNIFGFYPSFCAGIGLSAMFCGITNCPISTFILCLELFGTNGAVFFLIASIMSYICSTKKSLYKSQIISFPL